MCACCLTRASWSRRSRRRRTPTGCAAWWGAWRATDSRCGPRDRVDERGAVRARHARVRVGSAGRRRAEGQGLAPLACKTDRIDARVLAVLSERDLVPAIWLPDPSIRRERELARFRSHLVRHRTTLKNRIHATLITFGHPCPVSDL